MKFTKLFATALLLATFTFACGGKKAEETTTDPATTEQTAPEQTTEAAPADNAAENTATEAAPVDSAATSTEAAPAK